MLVFLDPMIFVYFPGNLYLKEADADLLSPSHAHRPANQRPDDPDGQPMGPNHPFLSSDVSSEEPRRPILASGEKTLRDELRSE
jgi:hypothetical protein